MSIDAVIAADRALLERLGFVLTPAYARLLDTALKHGESEQWLAHWLIRPAYGLGGCPMDIAENDPGDVDMLVDQLARIACCNCA